LRECWLDISDMLGRLVLGRVGVAREK